MAKPSMEQMKRFFKMRFKRDPNNSSYFREWVGRFSSPRRVWSFSDSGTRAALKKVFRAKFKGIGLNTNLNSRKYLIRRFDNW